MRARAQQLDPGLVADLHAPAGQQRDAAAQVGRLGSLAVVEVAAGRAQLVVERMDLDVALLADVAVLRLDHLANLAVVLDLSLLEAGRRNHVGGREHGLVAQNPDAGVGEHRLVLLLPGHLLAPPARLAPLAPLGSVRVEDVSGGREEPGPLLDRQGDEQAPVANDRLETPRGTFSPPGLPLRLRKLDEVARRKGRVLVLIDRHRPEGSCHARPQPPVQPNSTSA